MNFIHEKIDLGYNDLESDTRKSGRTYTTPNGVNYPSVTTVLSLLTEGFIQAWRKRVGEEEANRVGGRASARGTQVHAILEKYLKNEDTTGYLPHIRQSLENLKPILNKSIGKIYHLEAPLYSDHLGIAGRVDCVAEFDGVPSIVDFKTSKRVKQKDKIDNYFCQMSAYAIMWEERTGMPIVNTVIVMDVDDNEPLVFKEHRDNYTEKLIDTIDQYNKRKLFHG